MTEAYAGLMPYWAENSMPDRAAPASAAMSSPSPVFTSQPSALLNQAQPPLATTTAPARTR